MAKVFQEAFPELTDSRAEKYSRAWELDYTYPEAHRTLHKELREHRCRSCRQPLSDNKYIEYEWSFNNVLLCEHCHWLILLRLWIEELFESLSNEIKKCCGTEDDGNDWFYIDTHTNNEQSWTN